MNAPGNSRCPAGLPLRPVPEAKDASFLPSLIRAAEAMPAAAMACDVSSVVEALIPPDDAAAAGEVAAELLRLALSGAFRPVPLLRMAEAAAHLAAQRMEYVAWRAADFPAPDLGGMLDGSIAWRRAHAGMLAAGHARAA
ncbi:hypothetical protein HB662_01505 [Roseomonas frigidaquae]|uniref:Uncharacterized protein n=1 Tax=Falsiroseomonas frigidaquae TaxID=487318 RepID=A0ABX1ES24_9PROT|nr:hypothetical protein [Falsiroseomonas frigidaquae]NKE43435.1 hypothetical protein [Falsiroseomonas frigidaquae]